MIKKLPGILQAVILENNGLKQYLSNLQKGRNMTPRSWLYEQLDPSVILANWKNVLSQLENGSPFEQRVYQFDISSEEKWGPQGGIKPIAELLQDVVLPTFEGSSSDLSGFTTREWADAEFQVNFYLRDARLTVLRPAAYKTVVDDMRARDTLESNSGWPLFTRRKKPEVVEASIADATDGNWSAYPAIALFRYYRGKTRLVWMYPMSANLVEGSFFQPLQSGIIRAYQRGLGESNGMKFFAPWVGFEEVRKIITRAYEDPDVYLAASDFSQTDQHFQLPASLQVVKVLERCFQHKYQDALRQSIERMHNIPLVISQDEWIVGEHGVSSGSNWTNFIETVFDMIFGSYVAAHYGNPLTSHFGKVSEFHKVEPLYAIGDDMAWILHKSVKDFATRLEELGKTVGQVINKEKTWDKPDEVKTLQRLFQRGYSRPDGLLRGVYPTIRALNSLIYPERFHDPKDWDSDMFCARTYMILENCVDHPLFEQFVKFVVAGQKDLIPFAKKGTAELARISRESKLLPGLNPTYNAEKRDSSLASFESVKLASMM